MTASTLIAAARAIWDRGRTKPPTFDELSSNQKADLIADAAACLESTAGRSAAWDRELDQILGNERNLDIRLRRINSKRRRGKKDLPHHDPPLLRANLQ
ncbi:MAG: hypothetical protein EPO08_13880 [Rhodospirillaceae bacterium]|nr:MAG: hypothetical protein EPO08_13880 [Rhodospirillaceae bacterium]